MATKLKPAQTEKEWWSLINSRNKSFIRSMADWKKALANPKTNPLKGCSPKVIAHFTKNLKFSRGGFGHADYSQVAKVLTYTQFRDLFHRFGVGGGLFADHEESKCDGQHNCVWAHMSICMSSC